jgi:hypothetical protein
MTTLAPFITLSDSDLLAEVTRLATCERHATAQLVASLAELDARRLYLGRGFSSMFTYCVQALHLSEHAAYNRIEAARVERRFPTLLDRLTDGSITLTTVCLLAAHLTPENCDGVLDAAQHKTKHEVELLVAQLRPLPPVPSSVRKLPAVPSPAASSVPPPAPDLLALESGLAVPVSEAPATAPPGELVLPGRRPPRAAVVAPLTPEQYKVQVTVGRETIDKLHRVQALMRHTIPNADPAAIIDRALTVLLGQLERTKLAATDRPRPGRDATPGSRHVPARVRRAVWARDESRCAFVSADGRRCQERGFLELHHTIPYAAGGAATVETIELRCRAHNLFEAELDFGPRATIGSRRVYCGVAVRHMELVLEPVRPGLDRRVSMR